jgi:hypothetical protein
MKCNIVEGDTVVGVSSEFNLCPNPHPQDVGWSTQDDEVGRYFKVVEVRMDEDCPCVLLTFEGDPCVDHCWGEYRKVEPADEEFRNLIAKKVPEPA